MSRKQSRRPLVLASSSPYRRALLQRLGLPFTCASPDIDESPRPGEGTRALVRRLSIAKARAIAEREPEAIVIGSDQAGELGGEILNKPGTEPRAIAQLRRASGQRASFLTGLCVLDARSGQFASAVERCEVRFRALSDREIRDYVRREKPVDCAGSFKVEGLGITLFEHIRLRDPTALEGLPLIRLTDLLGRAGVRVLGA